MTDSENNTVWVQSTYFHTGNGGTTIGVAAVEEEQWPMLTVKTTHFGHLTHYSELFVNPQDLKKLGEHLIASAEKLSENELAPTVAEGPVSQEREREAGSPSQKGFVELFAQDDGTFRSQP